MFQAQQTVWLVTKKTTNNEITVCSTCLSNDRVLESMQNLTHLMNICNGLSVSERKGRKTEPVDKVHFNNKLYDKVDICYYCESEFTRAAELPTDFSSNELHVDGDFIFTFEDNVCWECKANLTKMLKFRDQALYCKSFLSQKSRMRTKRNVVFQSCSSMGTRLKTTYDQEFYQTIKEELEFKSEPENYSCEIKTKETFFHQPNLDDSSETQKDLETNSLTLKINPETLDDDRVPSSLDKYDNDDETNAVEDIQILTKIMDEEEMNQYRNKQKELRWYRKSKFKCENCVMFFNTEELLAKHKELHSDVAGQHKCRVCTTRFMNDQALNSHLDTHFTYYECGECGFKHQTLLNMVKHRKRIHDNTPTECEHCGMIFPSRKSIEYHILTVHKEKEVCEVCKREFKSFTNLKRHMLVHTGMPLVECDICHNKYRGEWGLKAHLKTHNNKICDRAYCAECDQQFKSESLYKNHLKYNKRHISNETLRFECSECGKKFFSKSYLTQHIERNHLKLANYVCDICKKGFNCAVTLKRHKHSKHEGRVKLKNHVCDTCGKAFATRNILQQHMNIHLGLRPYRCKVCNDTFSFSAALYTHNRLVHLKQKREKKKPFNTN